MATLKIDVEQAGTHTVLIPNGSLTYENAETLETLIAETVDQGHLEIILSGRSLSFADSAALELLLKVHEQLNIRGGALKLIEMDEVCRDIFIATGLINVLLIFESINQAIKNA